MPKVSVFDMAGKAVSEIELSEAVFGVEPNKAAMHVRALPVLLSGPTAASLWDPSPGIMWSA